MLPTPGVHVITINPPYRYRRRRCRVSIRLFLKRINHAVEISPYLLCIPPYMYIIMYTRTRVCSGCCGGDGAAVGVRNACDEIDGAAAAKRKTRNDSVLSQYINQTLAMFLISFQQLSARTHSKNVQHTHTCANTPQHTHEIHTYTYA